MFQSSDNLKTSTFRDSRAGMTLIELIITLSIMAAVASIALVTLSDMGEVSRYDETERRGLAAQRAVIGQPGEISRFFNDMGRYPKVLVHIPTEEENEDIADKLHDWMLAELYNIELQDSVNGTPIEIYTDPAVVRSENRFIEFEMDLDLTGDFVGDDDDRKHGTDTDPVISNRVVNLRSGWAGPYLINSYDRFLDNYGVPWATSTNDTKAAFTNIWTSQKAFIYPYKYDDICSIRSDYYTNLDTAGDLKDHVSDFLDAQDMNDYAVKIEQNTWPLQSNLVYGTLTVLLKGKDSGGSWVDLAAADVCPTNNFDGVGNADDLLFDRSRVMLYIPYCAPNDDPEICEIAAWLNGRSPEKGDAQGARYRVSESGGVTTTKYQLYASDLGSNGSFAETGEWAAQGDAPNSGDLSFIKTEVFPSAPTDTTSSPWTNIGEVEFSNVPVGTRKIWAYAYTSTAAATPAVDDDSEWYSTVQTIEIKPGHNVMTLYLTEKGF